MTKKILTILVLVLMGSIGFSQQKPKPKDKPPTQKEIDEMMREAQKEWQGCAMEYAYAARCTWPGKISGFLEFDNTGITDVGIVAGVEAKAGAKVDSGIEYVGEIGRTISVGATTRMGWNSGGSVKVFAN